MAEIKPAEISAILRNQLSSFNTASELEEVGTVLQVGDGIARIYGLNNVQSGELIEFANGLRGIVLNLEEDNVGAVLLGASTEIKEGDTVKVKVLDIDNRGKVRLSVRLVDQETGADLSDQKEVRERKEPKERRGGSNG